MAHEYDNAFRTMEMDCPNLLIPVVNEAFQQNYPIHAKVRILPNEQMITTPEDAQMVRITDSNFMIIEKAKVRYHIECESNPNNEELLVRMYQYDTQIALDDSAIEDGILLVSLPKSAVIYLRYCKNTPNTLKMVIKDGEQKIIRDVPIIKIQKYSLEEIFEKNLLFFLPFHIFVHEKELSVYNKDREKRKILIDEYQYIVERLEKLYKMEEIGEIEFQCIVTSMREVLRLLAKNYKQIVEEGEKIMGGVLLEYPAKISFREGKAEGRQETIVSTVQKLLSKQKTVEEVADLLDLGLEQVKEIEAGMMINQN